jgi:hypothetical protein
MQIIKFPLVFTSAIPLENCHHLWPKHVVVLIVLSQHKKENYIHSNDDVISYFNINILAKRILSNCVFFDTSVIIHKIFGSINSANQYHILLFL